MFCLAGSLVSLLPSGILAGDIGRIVTTFLGLLAASILPTISLIVGSMSATGRSVKGINELHDEFVHLVGELFSVLGWTMVAIVGLAVASADINYQFGTYEPFGILFDFSSLPDVLKGAGQFAVGYASAAALAQFSLVPKSILKALELRHHIAVDEARRKISENVPSADGIQKIFGAKQGFGEVKPVSIVEKL
ncbi:MAG: hypothetical protein A3D16_08685 [Rhodobacterales bacterium RIFCSPHIGHO2_02_FULL_62_130]|nr:MAG: hypothetical protein A3D16_08685 [Rhodobacterales bacterium RIFCSPHIGHO2_02_FULL_62_130]OHC60956.1 MAG: hypothetical protein A3E48_14810 [Rhodobacterales bacterium RIFCSPHIGHO2_12_FULL_62_75]